MMLHLQSFAFNPFSENTYVVYNEHKNAFISIPGISANTKRSCWKISFQKMV